MSADAVKQCEQCGAVCDPAEQASLAWVCERDDGATTWLCPACARRHVRDIEARLDREWW